MKFIFVGPSLGRRSPRVSSELCFRPPAVLGDIETAVLEGANVIGIVDGRFQQVQSVWHKEILFALEAGVRVLGAASMGALRAAECNAFGMIAVGEIAHSYLDGTRWDDSDVALLHALEAEAYEAITEPMVNVEATADRLVALGFATEQDRRLLIEHARSIFFAERDVASIFGQPCPVGYLASAYDTYRVDQKASDARLLIDVVRCLPDTRWNNPRIRRRLRRSGFWRQRESGRGLTPD